MTVDTTILVPKDKYPEEKFIFEIRQDDDTVWLEFDTLEQVEVFAAGFSRLMAEASGLHLVSHTREGKRLS